MHKIFDHPGSRHGREIVDVHADIGDVLRGVFFDDHRPVVLGEVSLFSEKPPLLVDVPVYGGKY